MGAATIFALVRKAASRGRLKRGVREATKTLNDGAAEFVILAGDAEPMDNARRLSLECKDKNVPHGFVASKTALGCASGLSRPVVA